MRRHSASVQRCQNPAEPVGLAQAAIWPCFDALCFLGSLFAFAVIHQGPTMLNQTRTNCSGTNPPRASHSTLASHDILPSPKVFH